jgi:predicted phosphodiesterase
VLDAQLWDRIHAGPAGESGRAAAKRVGCAMSTIQKYLVVPRPGGVTPAKSATFPARCPDPVPESGGPSLPDPVADSYEPVMLDTPGRWLVLSDVHIPHHDRRTVESAVEEARRIGAVGVLLNGDILDCGDMSIHDRDPSEPRLEEEVETGAQFFAWLHARLPKARIVWKEGNHEGRLPRYLARNAPALFGAKRLTLPKMLELDDRVEWVDGGRVINLGRLPVVHGHEFKGGGGVNPARWLFLQAVSTAMCGHFHRTSEHHEQGLDRRIHGVWSLGCACFLYPRWYRNNKWNHGYAIVEVSNDGHFGVTNRRILRDGRVA